MMSPEFRAALELIRATGRTNDATRSLADARNELDALSSVFPVDPDITVTPEDAGGVPAEWLEAPEIDAGRVVLYFHGGAYTQGSLLSHRSLCGRLSRACRARVLAVDYRLAPEHPHPAAVEDATTAYRWSLAQGREPHQIVVAGDSAGGGLTTATLLALRDDGAPLPAGAVLLSPWVDLTMSGDSIESRAEQDPICSPASLQESATWYVGDGDPAAPLVSPLFADLSGLPPVLILVGTAEVLLDDATRLADAARQAGVDVTLEVQDDLIHVYPMLAGIPEADQAVDRIGRWVRERTG